MTLTQDMPRTGSIDFNGANNSPTFTTSTAAEVYGGITLISAMTLTNSSQTYTFMGRGSYGLTSAGKVWGKDILVNHPSGIINQIDAFSSSGQLQLFSGSFFTNDYNATSTRIIVLTSANLVAGNSLITINGNNSTTGSLNVLFIAGTINSGTSTIKLTGLGVNTSTMQFTGKTINNLQFSPGSGTGEFQITGSNTFAQLKDDGTTSHAIKFTKSTTTTVADWQVKGDATHTITLDTVDGAGTFTLHKTGGNVSADYLNICRSTVDADPKWYAGAHSTNVETNTNWIFEDAPAPLVGGRGCDRITVLFSSTRKRCRSII
jgi:hypothetical protein